jgi:hypothetical protein
MGLIRKIIKQELKKMEEKIENYFVSCISIYLLTKLLKVSCRYCLKKRETCFSCILSLSHDMFIKSIKSRYSLDAKFNFKSNKYLHLLLLVSLQRNKLKICENIFFFISLTIWSWC